MSRSISFSEGEFYHLYNRGVDKRKIFNSKKDYERFQLLLFLANSTDSFVVRDISEDERYQQERSETLVDVGAYCLMPNHFHLLVREKGGNGVSKFMQKLQTGYTMYFNILNERTGSLFQGRFKAKHASSDRYLKYLFAYIHLNPEGKLNRPFDTYVYSSFIDHLGVRIRDESEILNLKNFPQYFETSAEIKKEMVQWLNYNKTIPKIPEVEPLG